jgi:hypothetical protein
VQALQQFSQALSILERIQFPPPQRIRNMQMHHICDVIHVNRLQLVTQEAVFMWLRNLEFFQIPNLWRISIWLPCHHCPCKGQARPSVTSIVYKRTILLYVRVCLICAFEGSCFLQSQIWYTPLLPMLLTAGKGTWRDNLNTDAMHTTLAHRATASIGCTHVQRDDCNATSVKQGWICEEFEIQLCVQAEHYTKDWPACTK